MNFAAMNSQWLARIERKLEQVLPAADEEPARLHTAMRYAVLGGGKRIRPALVYATGLSLGLQETALDTPAAAIELLHAFSLVHDDLPAMDDDELRRGKPTTHIAFDEATAILAADALQPLAFELLATDEGMNCPPATRLRMIALLAGACGSGGMTGGQSIDLRSEGQQLTGPALEHMYRLKTGRLLEASVISAAYLAEANERTMVALTKFIDCVGLAFQIRDDILDIEGETLTIGKSQGADIQRAKATWPAIFGMEAAHTRTVELLQTAIDSIAALGEAADPLRTVARYIVQRDH